MTTAVLSYVIGFRRRCYGSDCNNESDCNYYVKCVRLSLLCQVAASITSKSNEYCLRRQNGEMWSYLLFILRHVY